MLSTVNHRKEVTSQRVGRVITWLGAKPLAKISTYVAGVGSKTSTKKQKETPHQPPQEWRTCTGKMSLHNI